MMIPAFSDSFRREFRLAAAVGELESPINGSRGDAGNAGRCEAKKSAKESLCKRLSSTSCCLRGARVRSEFSVFREDPRCFLADAKKRGVRERREILRGRGERGREIEQLKLEES